ncbi:MAG: porin family protein [Candidatus Saccharicenans sp.]|nr:porin family protein [Candidatus Saccharicenans sp.]
MKKNRRWLSYAIIFLLIGGLAASPSRAQFHFGVKGGLALGNLKSLPETFLEGFPWKAKRGWTGGVFASFEFLPGISIQPEVLYIQKGARLVDPEYDFEARFNFDYFELPVLLKIDLPIEGLAAVPSVLFGPFFGFNQKASIVMVDPFSRETEDIKTDVQKTEYGITFGLFISQKWGPGHFSVDARYDLGLTNILKPGVEWMETIKTRTWVFMIGYSF